MYCKFCQRKGWKYSTHKSVAANKWFIKIHERLHNVFIYNKICMFNGLRNLVAAALTFNSFWDCFYLFIYSLSDKPHNSNCLRCFREVREWGETWGVRYGRIQRAQNTNWCQTCCQKKKKNYADRPTWLWSTEICAGYWPGLSRIRWAPFDAMGYERYMRRGESSRDLHTWDGQGWLVQISLVFLQNYSF